MTESTNDEGKRQPYKRHLRNFLIDPRFQLKYTGMIVGVATLFLLVLGAVIWSIADEATNQSRTAFTQSAENSKIVLSNKMAQVDETVFRTLQTEFEKEDARYAENLKQVEATRRGMRLALLLGSGAVLLVLAAAGIIVTHKVVGPVYKMKRLLRLVGSGQLVIKERLRKGDELGDLFTTFLEMVDTLRNAQREEFEKLGKAIKEAAASGASENSLRLLSELRDEMIDALEDADIRNSRPSGTPRPSHPIL